MNDEYLWDKTGSDADIERLESALISYRYRESVSPRLPVLETAIERRKPFLLRLSLAFAGAVCLAIITVLAMWLGVSRNAPVPTREVVQNASTSTPTDEKKFEPSALGANPTNPSISTRVKVVAPHRHSKIPIHNAIAKGIVKREAVPLTKDEKYAYDQLRLALWIAGSKVKIVQDTVDRVDEHKSSAIRNDR